MGGRTLVMGVLNVTPDSFSDGGAHFDRATAVERGLEMLDEGAQIIDVGAESTRPGAHEVPVEEELRRAIPVIEGLAARADAAICIDTTKSQVARAALDAGAVIINDVSAGRFDPRMLALAAESGAGLVLMHMQGRPRTMQENPVYHDVVEQVKADLAGWAAGAQAQGVAADRIAVDPGIGFGKTREHNLELIRCIRRFCSLGYPVLVGASRKAFIGATLDLPVHDRLEGTAAVVGWLVANGTGIVRVHDVLEMTRVVRMTEAIQNALISTP